MSDPKAGVVRVAGTGRFFTLAKPAKPLTKEGMARVREALSAASEKTGLFRSGVSGRYGEGVRPKQR